MQNVLRKACTFLPLLGFLCLSSSLFGQIEISDGGAVALHPVVPDGYADLGNDGPFPGCRPTMVTNPGNNPVMRDEVRLYYIWYGNWGADTARTILSDFADNLEGSPYYNINTTYFDPIGSVQNSEVFSSVSADVVNATDPAWQGANLTTGQIANVVAILMTSNRLPFDSNGVYMVLTSSEINAPGLCTQFCGYHTYFFFTSDPSTHYKFAFIPNTGTRCPANCSVFNRTDSPNFNVGADIMASVLAHEYEETTSDPDLNAWYDRRDGCENGDKCAYTYGTRYQPRPGVQANMNLGGRDFLIQENWPSFASGPGCVQSFP